MFLGVWIFRIFTVSGAYSLLSWAPNTVNLGWILSEKDFLIVDSFYGSKHFVGGCLDSNSRISFKQQIHYGDM